jgi:predicted nucleic acid-binding protein
VIVYADASALTKRHVDEAHSDQATAWLAEAELVMASRIAYVEVWRAIAVAGTVDAASRQGDFARRWREIAVIEVDAEVATAAARLALPSRLRALDAIHLASAQSVRASDLYLATFDRRLWAAAQSLGINRLPETLR